MFAFSFSVEFTPLKKCKVGRVTLLYFLLYKVYINSWSPIATVQEMAIPSSFSLWVFLQFCDEPNSSTKKWV
ncbi:unnamed protein product [Tenebrio molitor]|nr:unnamed protein product [Tenebrio molitor]